MNPCQGECGLTRVFMTPHMFAMESSCGIWIVCLRGGIPLGMISGLVPMGMPYHWYDEWDDLCDAVEAVQLQGRER